MVVCLAWMPRHVCGTSTKVKICCKFCDSHHLIVTNLRLPKPKSSPVNTWINIRYWFFFLVLLFFPFLFSLCCINQNPRTEDVLYSVCIPQPIATVIRLQSRVWLMDLLYLFFLSNITVCLLMLLVSFQGLYQLSWLQCGIQRVFKLAVNVVLGGQEKSIVAVWSSH